MRNIVLLLVAAGCGSAEARAARRLVVGVPFYLEDAPVPQSLVDLANRRLRDDDLVFVRGTGRGPALARQVRRARIGVVRQTLADLEADAAKLAAAGVRVDMLCYNPEGWRTSKTPPDELGDLAGAAARARALARRIGARLLVVPDSGHTLPRHGPALAAASDDFAVQLQKWQTEPPEAFRARAARLMEPVRRANPAVRLVAQLSTNPPTGARADGSKAHAPQPAAEILARIRAIADLVDGVGFLVMAADGGVERLGAVLAELRPDA